MKSIPIPICFLISLGFASCAFGGIEIVESPVGDPSQGAFPLVDDALAAPLLTDPADDPLVARVATLLSDDIERVSGVRPDHHQQLASHPRWVLLGTAQGNRWIRDLAERGKVDLAPLEGAWERFLIQRVEDPYEGVDEVLLIVGSDRRGAAFGALSLSEKMGVSPWYFWADVPVEPKASIWVAGDRWLSKPPSVKYRGIFLNDEDWGLHPWAAKHIDPEIGDIGPNTYAKVFELVLRLKGNMVAPAMHECTRPFFTVPGNMETADAFGILITTAHCEPLLYNNATEWDVEVDGPWNYAENRNRICQVLDERVAQASGKENIYTIALRGIHDEGMLGVAKEDQLATLETAIADQREILSRHIDKPLAEIPQIFVPYKEVLDIYEQGMDLPEDIILVWPDDNYGYLKKLSNPEELERSGGSGLYYHISYLGWPNDYLWLNTTPPALMHAELRRAYELGSDQYWLLNVGDIKPGEMGTQLFLDMAWDLDSHSVESVPHYEAGVLAGIFGDEHRDRIQGIFDTYYHLGFIRKPEFMTGDYRWNSLFAEVHFKDTPFSFQHYQEAESRLAQYRKIADDALELMNALPHAYRDAFFQLVYYPVKGSELYNRQMLIAQKNRWYASQGRIATLQLAEEVEALQDELAQLTRTYNHLGNGKWEGMMTAPGFLPALQRPPVVSSLPAATATHGIWVEGGDPETRLLPALDRTVRNDVFFEIFATTAKSVPWELQSAEPWIKLSATQGKVTTEQRISVGVDWQALPTGDSVEGTIRIVVDGAEHSIALRVVPGAMPGRGHGENHATYVETRGVVSIEPARFQRKEERADIEFTAIPGLGYSGTALQLGSSIHDDGEGSVVEYDFVTTSSGPARVQVYMLPLFAKDRAHSTRYGIQLNDGSYQIAHNDVAEYSMDWADNVMRNTAINTFEVIVAEPGLQTLRVVCEDPGMIVQKIVIDLGGLKPSAAGPESTWLGTEAGIREGEGQ